MRKSIFLFAALLLIIPLTVAADQTVVELVKKVRPSVVLIQTFDRNNTPVGQGSGFFISDKGDLVTSKHVVEGAYSATAKLITGAQYSIEGASAVDADRDVVKLRVKLRGKTTPFLEPANILPLAGEDILVVGNPLGLESTVSKGIVSAIREIPTFGKILQISAPTSAGSSGSPVLNMKGQVIGVATSTLEEGQALNFAIPSEAILNLETEDKLIRLSQLSLFFPSISQQRTSLPTVKAVNNPCLKFLPADWWLVGNFNLKAFFDFMDESMADNPAMGMVMGQYLQMIQGMVGIDPQKQVQYVTFLLSGETDPDPQGLVIIKGTFENSVPELRLRLGMGAEMEKTTYTDTALYESAEIGYCFPEQSTLVVGSPALLRRSVDVVGKGIKSLPSSLHGTLERTNGASIIWLAVNPKVVLEVQEFKAQSEEYSELFSKISSIECASLFFDSTHDGLLVSALGYVPEQGRSAELYSFLNEIKRNFLDVEGSNVFLCSFLIMSNTLLDGMYVRWNTHLTESALFELWETKVVRKKVGSRSGGSIEDILPEGMTWSRPLSRMRP